MAWRFKASLAAGAMGIYTVPTPDSTDDSPLTDPLNHIDRILWHPALRYLGRVTRLSGSLVVAAGGNQSTYDLVAHGQGVKPLMRGALTLPNGTVLPWGGSVPIIQGTVFAGAYAGNAHLGEPTSQSVWLTLGCDETYIKAYKVAFGGGVNALPITVQWTVDIFDRALGTVLPNSGPTRFRIADGHILFESPKGVFTSAKRYLRQGADLTLAFGKSIGMTYYNFPRPSPSSLREIGATWRYNSGTGYSMASERVYYGTSVSDIAAPSVVPGTTGAKF